jgi:hypothetical protein
MMEETEVEAKFEEIRPNLFGYILDTLAKAIQNKSQIKLTKIRPINLSQLLCLAVSVRIPSLIWMSDH